MHKLQLFRSVLPCLFDFTKPLKFILFSSHFLVILFRISEVCIPVYFVYNVDALYYKLVASSSWHRTLVLSTAWSAILNAKLFHNDWRFSLLTQLPKLFVLQIGLSDADPQARAAARNSYQILDQHYPQQAQILFQVVSKCSLNSGHFCALQH